MGRVHFAPGLFYFFDEDFFDDRFFDDPFLDPFFEDFFDDFFDDFFEDPFFGTLAPASRASDKPMAIACFLLVTFLPDLPLFSVPCLRSCIAFSTLSWAFLPYLAIAHPLRLKYWTARSCFSAASFVSNVPRFRRLPVFASALRE
jgi:hypothetical protein